MFYVILEKLTCPDASVLHDSRTLRCPNAFVFMWFSHPGYKCFCLIQRIATQKLLLFTRFLPSLHVAGQAWDAKFVRQKRCVKCVPLLVKIVAALF